MIKTTLILCFSSLLVILYAQDNKTLNHTNSYTFLENKGQIIDQSGKVNQEVKYLFSSRNGLNTQLRSGGFSYDILRRKKRGNKTTNQPRGVKNTFLPEQIINIQRIDVDFVGANSSAKFQMNNPEKTTLQYIRNGKLVKDIFQSNKITCTNIYDKIDVVFYANAETGKIKYDFVVHPGGDIRNIKLKYSGFNQINLIENALVIGHNLGELREEIPVSYILENDTKKEIQFSIIYKNKSSCIIGFDSPENKFENTLIIDPEPVLDWAYYLGDTLTTIGSAVTTDKNGNVYTCGTTQSFNSLATSGAYQTEMSDSTFDAYLMKFNSYGQCLWSTYFGGNNLDYGMDVMADTLGHVYMIGTTFSSEHISATDSLPLIQDSLSGASDIFLAKFTKYGDLIFSTYYGGAGEEFGKKLSLDFNGNVYITGTTSNSPSELGFGATHQLQNNGAKDAFLSKIDTSGVLVWSSYFGGSMDEEATGISFGDTNIFISGYTFSTDSISTDSTHQDSLKGIVDGYIAKFNPETGQRIWSTYFGGSDSDYVNSIKAFNEVVYFVGTTLSDDLMDTNMVIQTQRNGSEDAFFARINNENGTIYWGTYYGGTNADYGMELDIELDRDVFLIGTTLSDSLIATDSTFQDTIGGGQDAFLVKFESWGQLMWSTYYGGESDEEAYGVDVFGNTYIYVTGATQSTTGILNTDPLYSVSMSAFSGINDAFLSKFRQNISTATGGIGGGCVGPNGITLCYGDTVTLWQYGGALGTDAVWAWYKDGCGEDFPSMGYGDSLTFVALEDFMLAIRAESVTNSTDCFTIPVHVVQKPVAEITSSLDICINNPYILTSNGANMQVNWEGPNDFESSEQTPELLIDSINDGGYFTVKITDQFGCWDTAIAYIEAHNPPQLDIDFTNISCHDADDASLHIEATGLSPFNYNMDGTLSEVFDFENMTEGMHYYSVTDSVGCFTNDSVEVINPAKIITNTNVTTDYCLLNSGVASISIDSSYTDYQLVWTPSGLTDISIASLPEGPQTATVSLPNGCIDTVTIVVPHQTDVQVTAEPDSGIVVLYQSLQLSSVCSVTDETMVLQWSPDTDLNCSTCPSPSISPIISHAPIDYIVTYTSPMGCTDSDTVHIEFVDPCSEVFFPTAFSPNNDGLNDEWCYFGTCIQTIKLTVYNQWGEMIWSTTDSSNCWNGTYSGQLVPADSYVYHVELQLIGGETITQSGNVQVNY